MIFFIVQISPTKNILGAFPWPGSKIPFLIKTIFFSSFLLFAPSSFYIIFNSILKVNSVSFAFDLRCQQISVCLGRSAAFYVCAPCRHFVQCNFENSVSVSVWRLTDDIVKAVCLESKGCRNKVEILYDFEQCFRK